MENPELWLTPLILLPGVAMLIMSTSARYSRVHSELHHLIEHPSKEIANTAGVLIKRATLFRNALVSLYLSIVLFSTGALLGGLTAIFDNKPYWIVITLVFLGILSLVFASFQLLKESVKSLDIMKEHYKEIMNDEF